MLGYAGLQSSDKNSLPSIVVEKLFNSQREGADIDGGKVIENQHNLTYLYL